MKTRFLASVFMASSLATPAFADTPKWGAHLDFEGRWSNARTLGDAGLFAPLWQSRDTLLFTDIRGKFDSQDGREGNFGLGIRHMLSNGWNVGGYGYVDARRTPLGNHFNQVTLGVEALSADYDLRLNVYAPFGKTSRQIGETGGNPFADFSNGVIQIVTPGRTQIIERAMAGVDGEFGWRAPVFDVEALTQVRLYGGGFYFSGNGVTPDIAGPRGRVEFSVDDLFGFSHARLTLGAEVQHDDVRGTQGFAVARLRVPLQQETKAPRLTAQERRMTERVVRDVDIVSGAGRGAQLATEKREAAIDPATGRSITGVRQVEATTRAALQMELNAAGESSIIVLNGALTNVSSTTHLHAYQTLVGGGTALTLYGAASGTRVNFIAPGAAGSMIGAPQDALNSMEEMIVLSDGSGVGGLALTMNSVGGTVISGITAFGARVFDNQINASAAGNVTAVRFSAAGLYNEVRNNQITTRYQGVVIDGGNRNVVADNVITLAGPIGTGVAVGSGAQATAITGNRVSGHQLVNGLIASHSTDGTIANNTVTVGGEGIRLGNTGNYEVANNTVLSGSNGIVVSNSTANNRVVGNSITSDSHGFSAILGRVDLIGNSITANGSGSYAVLGWNSSMLKIAGNTIWADDAVGIYMGGGSVATAGSTDNVSRMSPASRCGGASGGVPINIGFDDGTCIIP